MIAETAARAGVPPQALGLELRLGASSRENARTKALRYLLEGRVQIRVCTSRAVRAQVRGGGHLWNVTFDARSGWGCDCPARGDCSHLLAVKSVVVVDQVGGRHEPQSR